VERLGKYEIVDKIGVGGFGVVYKGTDPFIKRPVAIKTCSAEDQETRERFLREAEIAGNLQHRNIVTVFEFGYQEGTPYLVQEFLSGEDLDHKIRRGDAISIPTKIDWLVDIARGMAFAHERGVVHRDIKPANIRILDDGHVKILDFGIAKVAQQQSNLTQAGVTLGTASYLAPEQIRGEPVDPRTDVFSFGVLAYELLSYEKPFRAQEISALFYKLLNEQPASIAARAPGTPIELVHLVERCLQKNPANRFSPTQELVKALEKIQRRRAVDLSSTRTPFDRLTAATTPEPKTTKMAARPRSFAHEPTVPLDQLELHPQSAGGRSESHGMAPAGAGRSRWPLFAAATVVGATALGIVWMLQGGVRPPSDLATAQPAPASRVALAPEPATSEPAGGADPGGLRPAAAAPLTSEPSDTSEVPTEEAGTSTPSPSPATPEPETRAPASEPAPAPKPPAPQPPKRARLVIGPAWDPAMTVEIGERRLRLDVEHTIEVPAGVTLLRFSLARPGFKVERPLRLQLKPGATERVSIPIEKPGRLTVQPHLNARPGRVRLDGEPAGSTPLRGVWLSAGSHFLEIFALDGATEPGFAQSVEIHGDAETIVTFDLSGHLPNLVREKPITER